MKYSTVKDLYELLNDDEVKGDFGTSSTKVCVKHFVNSVQALKSYLADLRFDIKTSLRYDDLELVSELWEIKNDVTKRILYLKKSRSIKC